MTGADHRLEAWFDLVGDLVRHPASSYPRQVVAAQLHATFGTEVSWNWIDPDGRSGYDLHVPIPGWPPPEFERRTSEAVAAHPLVRWFGTTGNPTAMTIDRVPYEVATSRGRAMVREFLVPFDMQRQLSIPYRLGAGGLRAFVLARGDRDFTDSELELARHIQTLLMFLDRQTGVLESMNARQATVDLSPRQLAVLALLAEGHTASAIGSRLGISPRTVHRHLSAIYHKLGVSDRVRAAVVARDLGLIPRRFGGGDGASTPAVLRHCSGN